MRLISQGTKNFEHPEPQPELKMKNRTTDSVRSMASRTVRTHFNPKQDAYVGPEKLRVDLRFGQIQTLLTGAPWRRLRHTHVLRRSKLTGAACGQRAPGGAPLRAWPACTRPPAAPPLRSSRISSHQLATARGGARTAARWARARARGRFGPAMADAKVYTYAEVAEHNTHEDCWMVIENKVLDITKFLDEHPGGDEVMMSVAGQDGTDEFEDGEWALMCLTHAPIAGVRVCAPAAVAVAMAAAVSVLGCATMRLALREPRWRCARRVCAQPRESRAYARSVVYHGCSRDTSRQAANDRGRRGSLAASCCCREPPVRCSWPLKTR